MNQAFSTKKIKRLHFLALVIFFYLYKIMNFHSLYQFKQEAYLIPHPQKAHRGGQDAYFSSNQLIIIADGVGGWNSYGIDPSQYSRFLCSKGAELYQSRKDYYRVNLVQLIAQTAEINEYPGSSTMLVALLDNGQLKTCYIGDSGFVIFRQQEKGEYKILFQFKQQQHSFNFPFQLARKGNNGDSPYLSICQDFLIRQNDIILFGSDGLFDNVYVAQILDFINNAFTDEKKLFQLKEDLAKLAIKRGSDQNFWSPFAQKAQKQNIDIRGGKLDDTTVIISKLKAIENYNTNQSIDHINYQL